MSAPSSEARFPRSRRLLSRADYQRILSEPGRGADAYFAVAAQPQAEGDTRRSNARLGLAISRKALSRAVDRNRVKRIVREAFRQTAWPCPVDVVVIARSGLLRGTNAQVRRSIDAHFLKVCRRLCGTDPLR